MLHVLSRNLFLSDHVLAWWRHKDDPNVLFLKEEDLQKHFWSEVCVLSCSGLLVYPVDIRARFLPFSTRLKTFQAFSQRTWEPGTSNPYFDVVIYLPVAFDRVNRTLKIQIRLFLFIYRKYPSICVQICFVTIGRWSIYSH